jgi:hypothetical protein
MGGRGSRRWTSNKNLQLKREIIKDLLLKMQLNLELKPPGNTANEIVHIFENVRVVTNLDCTRVITVITTGK